MGMRYGCLGGKDTGAKWCPQWSAWVCGPSLRATPPDAQLDPQAVEETRQYRALNRPGWSYT